MGLSCFFMGFKDIRKFLVGLSLIYCVLMSKTRYHKVFCGSW